MPEIGFLQARHFPRSKSQLTTGILSYGRIAAPHLGHADAGRTMDFLCGMRTIHTFKKLPITNPNSTTKTPVKREEGTNRI